MDIDIEIESNTIPINKKTNRYDTDKQKNIIDTIPITKIYSIRLRYLITSKLSFSSFIKKTGMSGDGGQRTFETIYRKIRYDVQH